MSDKINIKFNDKTIEQCELHKYAFESENTNIAIDYNDNKGFNISIFDIKTNIMRYYNIVNGELILDSTENVLTGEEIISIACDNCKYWNKYNRCTVGVSPTSFAINGEVQEISDTFSCSKWEAKFD